MATVTNTIKLPGGITPTSAAVEIELVASTNSRAAGWVTATDVTVLATYRPTVSAGAWSADLTPNADITPSGTVYKITEYADKTRVVNYIDVGSAGGSVFDLLADAPGTLETAALAAHAASLTSHPSAAKAARNFTGDVPAFTKYASNPIVSAADSALPSIYWPWVLRVDALIDDPYDTYFMWTSTDHGGASDGIELWSAPTPLGPWESRGKVYDDTTAGSETETPAVLWNEATSEFFMYYQQSGVGGGVQSTLLAKSPDGETWTRYGVVIQTPTDDVSIIGDGHCGYFMPFRHGGLWGGYHLMGGGSIVGHGISWSTDGEQWVTDGRPLYYNTLATGDLLRRVEWNHCTPIMWRGQPWVIGMTTDFVSGTTPKSAEIVAFPVSPDLRKPLAPAASVLAFDADWENANIRAMSVFVENGRIYLYYQCDDAIGVAMAEG